MLLQLHVERQALRQLQQQREGEAAAAAALAAGAWQAREHSQQAMRWVSTPPCPALQAPVACSC